MEFFRPAHWSGQPFPSPGDLPNPGMEPRSPALQADSLPADSGRKPKNTGVGRLSLLQRIFLTQELNRGLLPCRQIVYQLSYQGSPKNLEMAGIPYPLSSNRVPTFKRRACLPAQSLQSCPTLSVLWTVARQAALSMGFSKNAGVGCYTFLQEIFLTQGSSPCLLTSAGGFFTTGAAWEAPFQKGDLAKILRHGLKINFCVLTVRIDFGRNEFASLSRLLLPTAEEGLAGSSAESQRRLLARSVEGGAGSAAPEETLLRRRVRGRGAEPLLLKLAAPPAPSPDSQAEVRRSLGCVCLIKQPFHTGIGPDLVTHGRGRLAFQSGTSQDRLRSLSERLLGAKVLTEICVRHIRCKKCVETYIYLNL